MVFDPLEVTISEPVVLFNSRVKPLVSMMYKAKTSVSQGCGVTKARAVAGVAQFHVEEGYLIEDGSQSIDIIEFDEEKFFSGDINPYEDPEGWAEDIETIEVDPEGMLQLAQLHGKLEREFSVATSEDDWRVDYGDEDITYVIESEDGCVVGMQEHWDKAQEALEEVNGWDDGKTYWINEVEGEPEFKLTDAEGSV